ncbi:MAG TPA: inositol monophosphatase [Gammaproteobacteria bacterium]|mgnify:FL=1|nr:inositol monophosphatase [Gammaproteobacteria bacterium]MEC8009410.1 inositol monophosphatase family protein [Pseudomonadota bacterium]HBF09793.1 inositol monophosphatase [Gammaproteobacteria bacterium]HCK92165.1 inositol monophosphatase [Gammaproteobacteria bacterium]
MHPMLNIARRAAEKAGDYLERSFERVDQIQAEQKGRNDFVSEVDRNAEQMILTILQEKYPDHQFICEESGIVGKEGAEYQWIIDPLDGTTNFLHGLPHFAISMGIKHKGVLTHAMIYDPIKREEFSATRGQGAQLNGRRIRVSTPVKIEGTLLGTGMPFRVNQGHIADQYWKQLQDLSQDAAGIRRQGAAALDLAYVAAGRLDGFWEYGLQPWDMAAGILIVREAGGLCVDLDGSDNYLESGNIVAANPKLLKQLAGRLK